MMNPPDDNSDETVINAMWGEGNGPTEEKDKGKRTT